MCIISILIMLVSCTLVYVITFFRNVIVMVILLCITVHELNQWK